MRPSVPDGDLGAIVEQAVTEKLQRLEARRFAQTLAPRKTLSQSRTSPTTRQIPAAVKRAVYERDGGRCRYEDEQGRRCTARQGLEFITGAPSATAATTRLPTSLSRASATTGTWPRSTTAAKPSLGIAARGPVAWSRRRLPRRDLRRSREFRLALAIPTTTSPRARSGVSLDGQGWRGSEAVSPGSERAADARARTLPPRVHRRSPLRRIPRRLGR